MGFNFRKSFKVAPGVKLNLSKKSAGLSFGTKGFSHSVSTSGRKRTTVGIPGTGISYSKSHSSSNSEASSSDNYVSGTTTGKSSKKGCSGIIAIVVLIFAIIGGIGSCGSKDDSETTTSIFNNIELSIKSYNQEVELEVGETDDAYIYVNLRNEDFTIDYLKENLIFKSSNESIAKLSLDEETDIDNYVYYIIEAIGEGEAELHIETADGSVKSDIIKVTVLATETTTITETETAEETTTEKETTKKETTKSETKASEKTTDSPTTENKATEAEKETTKKAVETTAKKSTGRTVYVTPSGKRYHYSADCAGKNGRAVSIDDVGGRTACQKCAQ